MLSKNAELALAHFANLLKISRIEKNISVDDLAIRVGVSKPTMLNVLKGRSTVKIGVYFQAAAVLNVPLFDSDDGGLSGRKHNSDKIVSLLSVKVKHKPAEINDDF